VGVSGPKSNHVSSWSASRGLVYDALIHEVSLVPNQATHARVFSTPRKLIETYSIASLSHQNLRESEPALEWPLPLPLGYPWAFRGYPHGGPQSCSGVLEDNFGKAGTVISQD
jgi:hypothetical protein